MNGSNAHESNGHACPECGAPREPDGTPSCACTQRASDALRDARTAEQAAAEDFDPLRIRPYVELGGSASGSGGVGSASDSGSALASGLGSASPSDETMPLVAVPDETVPLSAVSLSAGESTPPVSEEPPRRRRRTVLLAVGGAVVAVVAAAGFASGLFSYDTPEREGALPHDIRASVPKDSSAGASKSPSGSASSAEASSGSPSPSLSTSPSSSASSTSAKPSRSSTPTKPPTTARATGSVEPTSGSGETQRTQVLRPGDKGAEVTELQLRLRQLNLYIGDASGSYDSQTESSVRNYQFARGVTADESGVYGAATRAKLESETSEP